MKMVRWISGNRQDLK